MIGTARCLLVVVLFATPLCAGCETPQQQASEKPSSIPDIGNANSNKEQTGDKPMEPPIDNAEFMKIPLNGFDQTKCSPDEPNPRWQGIKINAPTRVEFDPAKRVGDGNSFATIPVCGFYNLLDTKEFSTNPFQIVVMDLKTEKSYVGNMLDQADGHEIPPPDEEEPITTDTETTYGTVVLGGYFNPNVADYVNLPEAPAVYEVYVRRGEARSNSVKIEVTLAQD